MKKLRFMLSVAASLVATSVLAQTPFPHPFPPFPSAPSHGELRVIHHPQPDETAWCCLWSCNDSCNDKKTAEAQMLARAGIQPDVYAVTAMGLAGLRASGADMAWPLRALVATQNKDKGLDAVIEVAPWVDVAMMRDGMEALEMTNAKMESLGMSGFGPEFTVTCENHGGPGLVGVVQWDASAKTWNKIQDFKPTDMDVIGALIEEDSGAYATENNITPRCE